VVLMFLSTLIGILLGMAVVSFIEPTTTGGMWLLIILSVITVMVVHLIGRLVVRAAQTFL
jgi:uncharacterized membrane protein YccC